jgi:site-specific recombinase XerD
MPTVRIDDLDLEGGCVRICGKGRKKRLAPIGEYARTAINNYLDKRIAKFPDVRHNELFLNRLGGALTRRSMSRIVWKYSKMLGTVDPFSPHKLRHSFATHLLDNGADIMAIKDMLGHASLSSTQIYSSVTLKRLKKAYKKAHPRA